MKVILDTNIVLDVLLNREPFVLSAAALFALVEQSRIESALCATTITTIDYLLGQSLPRPDARQALRRLMGLFELAPVNRSVIEEALSSRITDFEDAVLAESGRLVGASVVITRNAKDFRHGRLKALDPSEFLAVFSKSSF